MPLSTIPVQSYYKCSICQLCSWFLARSKFRVHREGWTINICQGWLDKQRKKLMFRLNHQPYNNLLFFGFFLFVLFVHIRYFQFSHKTIQSRNNKPSLLIQYDLYLSCSLSWARLLLSLTKVPQWKVSNISFLKNSQGYVGLKTSKLCFMFM